MRDVRADEVRTAYAEKYLPTSDGAWQASYVATVRKSGSATWAEFQTEAFQRGLWEADDIASVGLGSAVVVRGAYADPEVIDALWRVRNGRFGDDVLAGARALDQAFEQILALVTPRHNPRRPTARLARIFATLRPREILCLLDAARTRQVREWLEQPAYGLGFIGQQVVLRQALREVLGGEQGVEDEVRFSKFSWFVWENIIARNHAAAAPRARLRPPTFEAVVRRFRDNPDLRTLVFSDAQIGLIHGALQSTPGKRFLLLAGLSGTGKTSMARGYAQAFCEALGLPVEGHYTQVAVWPDWTDPTGLVGFVNPLATPPTFQETEALRLLLAANLNPDKPYFLCLDEMNLARVEHYFAPFLSAMEGRGGRLSIHASRDAVDAVPPTVPWPENLFIIGTVNMDETTYPFSDKVLDRAFTFEFWDVDLAAWREQARSRAALETLEHVYPVLVAFSAALKPARRHFGYRTCDEVLGFCSAAAGLAPSAGLDAAILAKVLPKVRGDSGGTLPKAIEDAIALSDRFELPMTAAKLRQMQSTLRELGAVRFWS